MKRKRLFFLSNVIYLVTFINRLLLTSFFCPQQQSRQNFPGLVEKKLIEQLAVYWANTHEVEQKKMVDIQKEAGFALFFFVFLFHAILSPPSSDSGKREKKMMSALAAWGAGGGDAADELYSATQEVISIFFSLSFLFFFVLLFISFGLCLFLKL